MTRDGVASTGQPGEHHDRAQWGAANLEATLRHQPIIGAIKDDASLMAALDAPPQVVFLMYGSLLDLELTIAKAKAAGRYVFVDVDLLDGFAARPVVIEFVAQSQADGIVSRRDAMVKAAKAAGLVAGHRFYLVDTGMYRSVAPRTAASGADFIEVLPGCMPRVITWLRQEVDVPIVAGGLIVDHHDITAALDAGAAGVATSQHVLWEQC